MAQILEGTSKVLLFRELGKAEAFTLVLQQEHEGSLSRERESVATKFGTVSRAGALEDEVSITAIQAKDDPATKKLKDAVRFSKPLELWEVNLAVKHNEQENQFASEYRQGYLTEWTETNPSEDDPTVEGTFMTHGDYQEGFVTMPEEYRDIANVLGYKFHDAVASDIATDGLASLPEDKNLEA